ncbi:MAG: RNA polymerase sigma factor [bacterium]
MAENITSSLLGSDKNLFLRLKKYKDKQAFIIAYDKYVDQIYRFIFFKINNQAEAEDLTSQVFVKGWGYVQDGKLNDGDEYQSLKSLLYKIARNAVIDYYRTQKPTDSLDDPEQLWEIADDQQDLLTQTALGLDYEAIMTQLSRLKSEYRGVIVMRYIDQLSINEIAEILGKTKANVRVIIFRALTALKDLVNKQN